MLGRTMENQPRSPSPSLVRPDGTPVRVLVVDDEPDLTEVLTGVLGYEGWRVRAAAEVLVRDRLLRRDDLADVVQRAGAMWDALAD